MPAYIRHPVIQSLSSFESDTCLSFFHSEPCHSDAFGTCEDFAEHLRRDLSQGKHFKHHLLEDKALPHQRREASWASTTAVAVGTTGGPPQN